MSLDEIELSILNLSDDRHNWSDAEKKYSDAYKNIKSFASRLLGNINHICTNDFRNPTGADVYTDHGVNHSKRILPHLDNLLKLVVSKYQITLHLKHRFALICAVWLHDVGMFFRHPDYPDLTIQRKYHGRLARIALRQLSNEERKGVIKDDVENMIAEICELHQSNVKLNTMTDEHTSLLGDILLLADAFDISIQRTIKAEDRGAVLKMLEGTTKISHTSIIEWWINSCIEDSISTFDNNLILKFKISVEGINQWLAPRSLNYENINGETKKKILRNIALVLKRYINNGHLAKLRYKGNQPRLPLIKIEDIKIKLLDYNTEQKQYQEASIDHYIENKHHILPYDKIQYIRTDMLYNYNMVTIMKNFNHIKTKYGADTVELFLFDDKSKKIKYMFNKYTDKINGLSNDRTNDRKYAKICSKTGIIGHVSYCGIKDLVNNVSEDPRHNIIVKSEEQYLSIMLYPIIEKIDKNGKSKTVQWGVLMAGKDRHAGPHYFKEKEFKNFCTYSKRISNNIICALKKCNKPYFDLG